MSITSIGLLICRIIFGGLSVHRNREREKVIYIYINRARTREPIDRLGERSHRDEMSKGKTEQVKFHMSSSIFKGQQILKCNSISPTYVFSVAPDVKSGI